MIIKPFGKSLSKTIFGATLFSLASTASVLAGAIYQTGLTELKIVDESGNRHIDGFLWYPTDEIEGQIRAHGNQVWEAVKVIPDAAPSAGKRPLMVLSHGMFGNARNQAWLASLLTVKGYIVAGIDHPGTSTFQRDPDHRRELWQRPKDISRTIDHLLESTAVASLIDQSRIYMGGHSLGGFTAVALAGGRFNADQFDAVCDAGKDPLVCDIFDAWNVAKTPEDRKALEADLSDDRIAGFAVFDLGGTQTFSAESLKAIQKPMLVIGAPLNLAEQGLNLDIESRSLANLLPKETRKYLEPENLAHADFMGLCTDKALAILKEEEPRDVFVCQDGTDQRRAEHMSIAAEVTAFFGKF